MTDNNIDRAELIDIFAALDDMQTRVVTLLSKYPCLKLDTSKMLNRLKINTTPGAINAMDEVSAIQSRQLNIIVNTLYPIMFQDIRNRPAVVECMKEVREGDKSSAGMANSILKIINTLKTIMRI